MKSHFVRFLLVCSITCLCFPCRSLVAEQPEGSDSGVLRIISYNVQFLPPPAEFANKRPQPQYRADRIAEAVSQFDVIGLQETFHATHRDRITKGIATAWGRSPNSVVAPTPDGFSTNGGCALITKHPITQTNSTVFKHFSKPADYGFRADGFAAKGVIHARVARSSDTPDDTIDVFVTHLEARADDLRPLQYVELADFIKQTSAVDRPMVLMGDLNTNGLAEYRDDPASQYSLLMKELNRARPDGGVVDVWQQLRGDQRGGTSEQESTEIGKRIDYIFIGNPASPGHQLRPKSIEVRLYQDAKVTALSDHNAVAAEFHWTKE